MQSVIAADGGGAEGKQESREFHGRDQEVRKLAAVLCLGGIHLFISYCVITYFHSLFFTMNSDVRASYVS